MGAVSFSVLVALFGANAERNHHHYQREHLCLPNNFHAKMAAVKVYCVFFFLLFLFLSLSHHQPDALLQPSYYISQQAQSNSFIHAVLMCDRVTPLL